MMKSTGRRRKRRGFTLLELMLSLSLIVMATAIIGSLLQMYSRNFATRGEDIRRMQLARALLNMIAEDIRAVVLEQEYDTSVLDQQLGAGGESGGGDPSGGAGDAGGGGAGGSAFGDESGGLASDSADPSATGDELDAEEGVVIYPPGIFGDQYTLTIDVSRLPRPDEYNVQQASLLDGTLTDIPGDIKTVTYYVQNATNQGVTDNMSGFGSVAETGGFASGLVRRALDRGVMAYAEELGNSDGLNRTGDLVAPEVIALEFSFYDSELGEWVYEWDSSQQSLPWLVQISLAMQSATDSETSQIEAGTPLSSITFEDQRALGIEVYELVVAIPGANLIAADAAQAADTAAGMEGLGL